MYTLKYMRSVWDFNENKNYITVNDYKVINSPNSSLTSLLLRKIDILVLKLQLLLINSGTVKHDIYLNLLASVPHFFQEMQLIKDQGSIKFNGLNKPKDVYLSNQISIGDDKKLRSRHRRIFLTLKTRNGKLKTLNQLKPLIAHELTHTALNHVTWKDDNHSSLFNKYNKIILRYLKEI